MAKKDDKNLFLLIDESRVFEKNVDNLYQNQIYKAPGNILEIVYSPQSAELYIAGQTSWAIADTKAKRKPIGFCGKEYNHIMAFNRFIPLDKKILALSFARFGLYSDIKKSPDFCSDGIFPEKRFISGSDYKNNAYLMGGLDGLFIFKDNTLIKSDSIHFIFRSRINDIKTLDGKFLLGTLGNGLGIWDGDKKIHTIQKSDGILSDNFERIYVDDQKNVYLCSKAGLTRINFISDFKYKIQNYTRHHGLSSNIVNDVIRMGDSLFIATEKGLCVMPIELHDQNRVV